VLRRTAQSTNIRDRLDFSCAIFDAEGGLVANAPHIPVHLGAMGESVRAVMEAHPHPSPGDAFVTNDPARGGSHLPDITVVTPVFDRDGTRAFFVASRGHHADVGGITPGSMPAFSRTLDEEGVVFRAERIVHRGRFDRGSVLERLTGGPHPARHPEENLADLEAELAANRKGELLLGELVARYGRDVVAAYMAFVQDDAARRVEDAIEALPDGEHRFADALDDGTRIAATLRVTGRSMVVDFEGTGPASEGNLNAPRAVTVAAVLYVLRCLVGHPIPLNAGCLRPVEIRIPEGSILAPDPARAVAGGNVETSQRVVDVLLGALGKAAASQGTMNNLTFGDARFGYYETLGGGAGAGPGFDGASAVHTHMTNSRLTDAEVIEARFPVRVTELSIRRGSGGEGRHRGGDGLVRELELLAPLDVSILSERRERAPFGLAGGGDGARGRNYFDGREVPGRVTERLPSGAHVRIETPGGGGFGARDGRDGEGDPSVLR
jgi:5-oxoprolinase (ATP-hydrolysing)